MRILSENEILAHWDMVKLPPIETFNDPGGIDNLVVN